MATKPTSSEAQTLEQYRIALENVQKQPEIAAAMAELGYDDPKIQEGKAIWTQARQAYDTNKIEDDETSQAYATFTTHKQQLHQTYTLHRKKAKVIFNDDPVTADKLGITGSLPQAYINWLETIKKFYATTTTDTTIQTQLQPLKITPDDLNAAQALINQVETTRAEYQREVGESQNATKTKDTAMAKIDTWMSPFYAVAKIALEDQPQLLEALAKPVKS